MIRSDSRLGCAPGSDCCAECAGQPPTLAAIDDCTIQPAVYIAAGIGIFALLFNMTKRGPR